MMGRFFVSVLLFFFSLSSFAETICEEKGHKPDTSIILAIDVSASIDDRERWAQFRGYGQALLDPAVQANLENCLCVEMAVVFWASDPYISPSFTTLNSVEEVMGIANSFLSIAEDPSEIRKHTSQVTRVYKGLKAASDLMMEESSATDEDKKVIIISGDGYDASLYANLENFKELKELHDSKGVQIHVDGVPIDLPPAFPDNIVGLGSGSSGVGALSAEQPQSDGALALFNDYPSVADFYKKELLTSRGILTVAKDQSDIQAKLTQALLRRTCNVIN